MKIKLNYVIFDFLVLSVSIFLLYKGYLFYLKKFYPIEYYDYVSINSQKYNIEKELIFAVIKTESNFIQKAKSEAGAIGLMQIMPSTFCWLKSHKFTNSINLNNLEDPAVNIEYGTYLLSFLKKRYNGVVEALSAYNAGGGIVDKWLKDSKYSVDGKILNSIPYPETKLYVKNVINSKRIYKNLYFSK